MSEAGAAHCRNGRLENQASKFAPNGSGVN